MKQIRLIIFSLFLFSPFSANAADISGKFAVRGAGLLDCQTFLDIQQKRAPEYLMVGGWIDGYITGINQYSANTYDATSFESTELFVEFIKNHCMKHTKDRLFAVINAIIKKRWNNRLMKKSQLISISLGQFSTQIYHQTLEKMQKKLTAKGFYNQSVTGRFDGATISAIAEFQKTIKGFKATGFPDQATLWAIFSE